VSPRVRGLALGVYLLLALVGRHAAADDIDERLRGLARASGQKDPVLRIGLADAHSIAITSAGSFRIVDPDTGEPVWKATYREKVHLVAEGGPREGAPSIYRIQVGAFGKMAAAEREKVRLERLVGASGVVHRDPDRGTWRVRIGQADDRMGLGPLMDRLREAGLKGLWIAEEPAERVQDVRLRLVDESFESRTTPLSRLAVLPSGRPISVDGTTYRGVIELRVSPFGTVRPINWVGLEWYLRGVVPAELGPEVWPELQALQAQAVAARTYVWRNLGQFGEEGFDLCATPRCQVYAGAEAEHPLSDRAVVGTRGEILATDGRPIVALYTATCGGHTEDGAAIFPENAETYLTGVPCRAEGDALATHRGLVAGRRLVPLHDETGAEVTRDWALLAAAGVVERSSSAPAVLAALSGEELRAWTRKLAVVAGRPAPSGPLHEVSTLGQMAVGLLEDTGWSERATVLVSTEDLDALLRDPSASRLPQEQRRALAYLGWVEGLRPFADGELHADREASRARLAPALVRIGDSYEAFGLRSAIVSGVSEGGVRMVQGKGEIRLQPDPEIALFALTGGKPTPSERLELWPGDQVRFRTGDNGRIDFLELLPPVSGVADDRTSRLYSWEVRKTRAQIEAAINRRVSVGRLQDLRVVQRGVSGRIVELEVVGTRATTVVRGFDVRRLLDLRESLIVFEIQRDASGRIEAVVFAGKGWGHGVGLCQVGAYGMALRGSTYREILGHYYTGATLVPLESVEP
jgi:stage II sporulation protein D